LAKELDARFRGHERKSGITFTAVMPGLDPGIHDEARRRKVLLKTAIADWSHGLPGQARQ
jgi:hypothetical protein